MEDLRRTLSFYRYVHIADPKALREKLVLEWAKLGVLGRIYLAEEGINAQISVPLENLESFKTQLYGIPEFTDIPFKFAVTDGESFDKLKIKVKRQIVADALPAGSYDLNDIGQHVSPQEFNKLAEDPETVIVDMRNQYESRIGHFKNAVLPDADMFREELPKAVELVQDKKDKKVLLYCTGGIRCEKASAYFKHNGFKNVYQLHGGIIQYAHAVREQGLPNLFRGKNFVFDNRLAERISDDVVTNCDQCGATSDRQLNCANQMCHILFVQCDACGKKFDNTCSKPCQKFIHLPPEKQKLLRKGNKHHTAKHTHHSRLRPKINSNRSEGFFSYIKSFFA